jgi:sugar lactone lactonase YvrE
VLNNLNSSSFEVIKQYSDDNTTPVTVNLSCGSATITTVDGLASPGDPAQFTVEGAVEGATCTVTESGVPDGYTANRVPLSTGSCTVLNNLNSSSFEVIKQYSDDNTTPVTVNLNCSSGIVSTIDGLASPGDPAQFTVEGAVAGTTCTATESGVPADYARDESACQIVSLSSGSCTIVNTFDPRPPRAPTDLTAEVPEGSRPTVHLRWKDNASNESGFGIERIGGDVFQEDRYVPADVRSFWDSRNLACETEYEYQVWAYNEHGDSARINASATTEMTLSCVSEGSSGMTSESSFGSEGSGDGEFSAPAGVEVDGEGNVVIADTGNDRVQVCDSDGTCTTLGESSARATTGVAAGFLAPEDVAIDSAGRIIVADTGNHRIQVCTAGFCNPFGGPGTAVGRFDSPRGVAVDSLGRILVADTGNDRIQRCDDAGNCSVIGSAGPAPGQFNAPVGITAGHDLSIWVADTGNHRVQNCDAEGNCTAFGGFGAEPGSFDTPTRIGMDLDERLVIADSGNQRVQMCTTQGDCVVLDSPYGNPMGVTIDNNGQIVVVDATDHSVELLCLVSAETSFGSQGSGPGEFSNPASVALGSDGRIIVADRDNDRIQLCNTAGTCSSFGSSGSGVGDFSSPSAVAVDSSDRIIVADTGNDRIQICNEVGSCSAFGVTGIAPGTFYQPGAVATDGSGGIIVADTGNDRVQLCNDVGVCTAFGSNGSGAGEFSAPLGVAVGGPGQIVVADSDNDRIQTCDTFGFCTSMFGSGTGLGQFQGPRGIALDENGRMVIADSQNGRIQVCDAGSCSAIGGPGPGPGQFAVRHAGRSGRGQRRQNHCGRHGKPPDPDPATLRADQPGVLWRV